MLIRRKKTSNTRLCWLTLSASQTLTVLSKEDVASLAMLGLKRTSVMSDECSSSVVFCFKVSVYHKTACKRRWTKKVQVIL